MENITIVWLVLFSVSALCLIVSLILCLSPHPLPYVCKPMFVIPLVFLLCSGAGVAMYFDFKREDLPETVDNVIKTINMETAKPKE